ncbi:hypothetical protein [uncultured Friedmanniella sp.]|uniref:hypothetical protein n=1 Tax=uncultured Friedmanniella sp. TaxID=335381 RepID=UPI0035C9DDE7
MDPVSLAAELLAACVADGQAARRVADDDQAEAVRAELRRRARRDEVRVRTARLGDTVVVARTDAAVWTDDAATMRRKLSPPD